MHIAIIGGGAAGLISLKTILDTLEYATGQWSVVVYEAREDIGGVWLPSDTSDDPPLTPLYDSLTTNLPHPVMALSCLLFPPETPLYPHASVVLYYLKSFAESFDLRQHIRFSTRVENTTWDASSRRWKILLSDRTQTYCDRLIVANGHFRVPRYPDLPGLECWIQRGKITHSAWYRRPANMGDIILVVGGGPSANDISRDMHSVADVIIRSIPDAEPQDGHDVKVRGAVTKFLDNDRVEFQDGSTLGPIDHAILATGYKVVVPFFDKLKFALPSIDPLPRSLINTTYSLFPLAKHIFPLQSEYPPESVAFVGLPTRVIPFPLMEAQILAIIQVLRVKSTLDLEYERAEVVDRHHLLESRGHDQLGIAKRWHAFREAEQFDYCNQLFQLAGLYPDRRVAQWVEDTYAGKDALRELWTQIEGKGEARQWLIGVGHGGIRDWIELIKKLLDLAQAEEKN